MHACVCCLAEMHGVGRSHLDRRGGQPLLQVGDVALANICGPTQTQPQRSKEGAESNDVDAFDEASSLLSPCQNDFEGTNQSCCDAVAERRRLGGSRWAHRSGNSQKQFDTSNVGEISSNPLH